MTYKRFWLSGMAALLWLPMMAEGTVLKTRCTQVTLDNRGYYQSIRVEGKEIISNNQYPVVTTGSKGKLVLPTSMTANDSLLTLKMDDGGTEIGRAHV